MLILSPIPPYELHQSNQKKTEIGFTFCWKKRYSRTSILPVHKFSGRTSSDQAKHQLPVLIIYRKLHIQFKSKPTMKCLHVLYLLLLFLSPSRAKYDQKLNDPLPDDSEDMGDFYNEYESQTKLSWHDRLKGVKKPARRRLCCAAGAGNDGCGSCPAGKYDRRPYMGRYRPYWGGGCGSCCQSCTQYVGGSSNSNGGNINLPTMTRGKGYNSGSRQTRCNECNGEVYNSGQNCRACSAGKIAGNPWGSCTNCPSGRYQGPFFFNHFF